MKRDNFFRKFSYAICLCAVALLAVSCSDQPGPISPLNSGNARRAGENSAATGEVRPVKMLEARNTLAKGTPSNPQANQHLQDLIDELQYIVDSRPNTSVAKALINVVAKVKAAKDALNTTTLALSNSSASGNLASAKIDLQAAIRGKLLNSIPGNQFIAEITAIESSLKTGAKTHDCRGTSKLLWMTKAEGGLIAHCGHRIIVPRNALKNDSQMSIEVNPSSYITVDLGPDGWFNSAVAVGISYQNADLSGIDLNALILAWFDALIGKWLNLGGSVDTANKIVWVKTYHFTQYTISTK